MKLIITEKPSVAQSFAQVLGVTGKKQGYIENSEYIITWCVGHLVTMSYPEKYDPDMKKWKLEKLPFLPDIYKYEVIPNVKAQFKVVKECLNRSDVDIIYNAGDSGREGEYIQRLVLMMAGYNKRAQLKRIWIDSQTADAIRQGIRDAKDASAYNKLSDAAYMRAIEDYAIGINFSRALTCKYGYEYNQKIKTDKFKSLNVGRVMTCVLGMIVDVERAIRQFVPTPFFRIESNSGFTSSWKAVEGSHFFQNPILYNESGFKRKVDAQQMVSMLNKVARLKIISVSKKKENKKPPLLYNLAELQNECSKKYKISPDKTLEIAQKLYEAKLTTYPRTDARVLSSAVAVEVHKNLSGLSNYAESAKYATNILQKNWFKGIEKSSYTDDSKITDHYAIIPTGITNVSGLDELELNVFHLIIKRFLSIFYPPAVYEKIEVVSMHPSKENFFASEKLLQEAGYLEILEVEDSKQSVLANIQENTILDASFAIKEGSTTPPKRYTSGSLVLAMENAGNLIEDEELRAQIKGTGIGTSATRGETISKLIKVGYINLNQKTQVITPHEDGEILYDIVKNSFSDMLSPKMTASWEKGLTQIEEGKVTKEEYIKILNQYVLKNINMIKNSNAAQAPQFKSQKIGVCPICGGDFVSSPYGGVCSNKGDKCWFQMNKCILEHMDNQQLDKLFTTGCSDVINGFISKKNKPFSAAVQINKDEKKIEYLFPEDGNTAKQDTELKCPKCGKKLTKQGIKLTCDCKFTFYSKLCEKVLDEEQIKMLLSGLTIEVSDMQSKKGKLFSAKVSMEDDGKLKLNF